MNNNLAVEKAVKMLQLPMNKLPEAASKRLKKLSDEIGFCGETCITAYAYYNQAVLNLPCDDELYKIPANMLVWFKENNLCK